jgi:hypothetical protein
VNIYSYTEQSWHIVEKALACIPLVDLKSIYRRMWRDLKENCSGFPDLIIFKQKPGNTESSYELIEIKGPGDTIQKNQQRWMQYFSQCGIPHKLVDVEWQDLDEISKSI